MRIIKAQIQTSFERSHPQLIACFRNSLNLSIPKLHNALVRTVICDEVQCGPSFLLRNLSYLLQLLRAELPVKYVEVLFHPRFIKALHNKTHPLLICPSETNLQMQQHKEINFLLILTIELELGVYVNLRFRKMHTIRPASNNLPRHNLYVFMWANKYFVK